MTSVLAHKLWRILFALIFVAPLASAAEVEELPRVFLLNARQLSVTREKVRKEDKAIAPALEMLIRNADEELKAKLVSVMDKTVTPPSGDKHDYMSQAPYFWPNPDTTNGLPYLRRDGERNPEIYKIPDHGNILNMPEKVETLALAYFFTGNEKYAAKASEFLRAWFLNPATRMKPHLQFSQAVPGVNTGRGTGLIESRNLSRVVDAVGLLQGAKAWTEPDQNGLEKWYDDFLRWMLESENGRAEAAAKNNHGTYYDLQIASFALFLNKTNLATEILAQVRTKRIPVQIEPDGQQPLELARTKAWSYSVANLSGLMSLARLAENVNVELWHFETPDGRSIRKAVDYLVPFATREKKWAHQQLGGWSPDGFIPLLRQAAIHNPRSKYQELLAKLAKANPASRNVLLDPQRATIP
jgi:hypothetical protein